jgi:hypothetical protein
MLLWDVRLCGLADVCQPCGGNSCVYLEDKICGQWVHLKRWYTPTMLHGVTSCNTALLTLTTNLSDLTRERPPAQSLSPVLCSVSDLPQQAQPLKGVRITKCSIALQSDKRIIKRNMSLNKSSQAWRLLIWIWEMPFRISAARSNIPTEVFRGQSHFPLDNSLLTQIGPVGLSSEFLSPSFDRT